MLTQLTGNEIPHQLSHRQMLINLNMLANSRTKSKTLKSLIIWPISVAAGPPWGSARELFLSPLPWRGTPPTPGPGEGDVTTPAHRSIVGTTGTSLLRGAGGF
jgi:hypothetical protein